MPGYDGSVVFDTRLDTKEFEADLNRLKMSAVAAFAAVSAAVTASVASVISAGGKFESIMSQVGALSGAAGDEFDALKMKAEEMGASTVFSASQAAQAFTYMAQAGWQTEDMLSGIEGIMNLAAASGEDLALTSDIVTDALTAFGLSASDSAHFADVLATASAASNTNVAMMGETFKYVGAMAGTLGYSVEDVSTAIGLMANTGIKGTMAGTSLNAIFTRLSTNTSGAADAIESLGVKIYDSDGKTRAFKTVMDELRTATQNMTTEQKANLAYTVAGTEASKGLLAIINSAADDYNNLSAAINNANGSAKAMSETMVDNLQGDFTLFQSALEGLQIAAYDCIEEPFREATQSASKSIGELTESATDGALHDSLENLGDSVSDLISSAAELAVSVLPTLINAFSFLLENAKTITTAILASVAAMKLWQAGLVITKTVTAFGKAWKLAATNVAVYTAAEQANTAAGQLVLAMLTAKEILVGVLTGKITLATAAQALWNKVMAANPVGLALIAITAFIGIIACVVNAIKKHNEENKKLSESLQKIKEDYDSARKAAEEQASKTKASGEAAFIMAEKLVVLKDKLDLLNKSVSENEKALDGSNRVSAQTAVTTGKLILSQREAAKASKELDAAVKALKEQFPDLASAIVDETGKIKLESTAIRELAESYRDLMEAKALAKYYESDYDKAVYSREDARKIFEEKKAAYEDAEAEYDEAKKLYNEKKELYDKSAGTGLSFSGNENDDINIIDISQEYTSATARMDKAESLLESTKDLMHTAEEEVKRYNKEIDGIYDKMLSWQVKEAEISSELTTASEKTTAAGQAESGTEKSVEEYKATLKELDYLHDMGQKSDAEYYSELAANRDKYLEEGSDEWKEANVKIYNGNKELYEKSQKLSSQSAKEEKERTEEEQREFEKARDAEFALLKNQYKRGEISAEEYYDKLRRLNDAYFNESSEEWKNNAHEIKSYFDSIQKNIANAYSKLISTVQENIDTLKSKMSGFADGLMPRSMFEEITKISTSWAQVYDKGIYKGTISDSKEETKTQLIDLAPQIKQLEEFKNNLENLKKDGIDDLFIEEIKALGGEEGQKFAKALTGIPKEERNAWIEQWKTMQQLADDTSASLYQQEYEKTVDDTVKTIREKFAELGVELPENFFDCGTESAKEFGSAFKTEIAEQMNNIASLVGSFSSSLALPLISSPGVSGTSNSSVTNNYNFTGSGETVYEQMQAVKNADSVKTLRGD